MAVIHGNEENFNELINNELVLVDFYADWCGPCKMLAPVLEELDNIDVVKVNVDEAPELAKKYGIMTIPNLLLFEKGELKASQSGFMPRSALEEWINKNK